MNNHNKELNQEANRSHFLKDNKKLWVWPILLMFTFYIGHFFYHNYASYIFEHHAFFHHFKLIEKELYATSMVLCCYWLLTRLINKTTNYLALTSLLINHSTLRIILPFFSAVLKALAFLALFNVLAHHLSLPAATSYVLTKITSVLIIASISWILFKLVNIAEQLLLHHYRANASANVTGRKIYTQTLILKRVAYSIITILTAGAILVLFDNVRALGASVLTTAGVVGLVLTFTAQRSLASLFSGLEIALTQPIKIGDSVVIENELGTIEEINFRNVIVKLWDWRRLIVPTSYFLEKSFQNWSREQHNNLIGSVYLYVDFTLPVAALREKLMSLLKDSVFWDGNIGKIQVGDLQKQVMQLKILASAKNADDVSSLRAEIREKLISYIVQHYPNSLPTTRYSEIKNSHHEPHESQEKSILEMIS